MYVVANTEGISFPNVKFMAFFVIALFLNNALDSSTEFEEKLIPLNVITKCIMVDEKELFRKNAAYFL